LLPLDQGRFWHHHAKGFYRLGAVMTITLAVMLPVGQRPALSQAVNIVEVDVKAVSQGYRASKIIGASVMNDKNEKIGSVDDIIIGRDKALFAAIEVGGFLGLGAQLVAVPYDQLVLDAAGTKVTLPGASKEALKKLPVFKYGV
jgi:sporulation protein YlmC with PRC-barrel domain